MESEIVAFKDTADNLALLKTTLAGQSINLNDSELQLFLYQVKRTGLDPLARQIYVMRSGGRISFITSIDGYRLVAERSGKYLGQTKTDWTFDGEGKLVNATVGVIKANGEHKETTYATAWMDEVNSGTFAWKKMPKLMLAKVAESFALRKAFPQELSNIYTEEEMGEQPTVDAPHYEEPSRDIHADVIEEAPVVPAATRVSYPSIIKVKKAFAAKGMRGEAVTDFYQKVLKKAAPTTEADAETIIMELGKLSDQDGA